MRGRHTVLRKELFAHRRELVLWTSWGLLIGGVNVVIVWYGGYLNVAGPRVDRRHHGVPVVHVPAAEPGVEHRQLVLRAAAVARGDGAGVRGARRCRARQAGPAGRASTRRASCTRSASRTSSSSTARAGRWCATSTSTVPGGIGRGAGRPQRRRQDDGHRSGRAVPRSDAAGGSCSTAPTSATSGSRTLPRPARDRAAGRVPVRRLGARQHRLRPARRDRRRGRGRGAARQRARVHRQAARAATRRSSASAA